VRPATSAGRCVDEEAKVSYARGSSSVDWEDRIDFGRLRGDRVRAVQRALAASDLDGLLLWKDENVRYLTSLRAQLIAGKMTSLNGVLITKGGEPILLCSGGEIDKASMGMSWLAAAHPIPIMEQRELVDGFVKATLTPLLAEDGIDAGRIGVDQVNYSLVESMREHLPDIELSDGDTLMQRVRLIKSPDELAIIEEACAIGDSVTQRAIESTRVGRRENEVAGDAMQTLYYLGGEMAHVITPFVASGEHMSPPHRICTDKIIRNGDLCFIDIGAMWNGYFADIGRTMIVNKPNAMQKRVYRAVYDGLMTGVSKMRPGHTNQDVADAIVATVREHGFGDNLFSLFIGHGIGMGANEPPYIGETMPGSTVFDLEPGMVFAVEPLVWVPGVSGGGGVRIEDMVLVTDGEARILSRVEYEERLLD
jgi:Xaa-Pro aminopeptidase